MYVCEECYDRDKRIVGCSIVFTQHECKKSKCNICGKLDVVADCWAYGYTTDPWADFVIGKRGTGERIMYVCEKCHDRDKLVINCKTPFNYHHLHIRSTCDICGKFEMLSECLAYDINMRKTQCLSVSGATNGTK